MVCYTQQGMADIEMLTKITYISFISCQIINIFWKYHDYELRGSPIQDDFSQSKKSVIRKQNIKFL